MQIPILSSVMTTATLLSQWGNQGRTDTPTPGVTPLHPLHTGQAPTLKPQSALTLAFQLDKH